MKLSLIRTTNGTQHVDSKGPTVRTKRRVGGHKCSESVLLFLEHEEIRVTVGRSSYVPSVCVSRSCRCGAEAEPIDSRNGQCGLHEHDES